MESNNCQMKKGYQVGIYFNYDLNNCSEKTDKFSEYVKNHFPRLIKVSDLSKLERNFFVEKENCFFYFAVFFSDAERFKDMVELKGLSKRIWIEDIN